MKKVLLVITNTFNYVLKINLKEIKYMLNYSTKLYKFIDILQFIVNNLINSYIIIFISLIIELIYNKVGKINVEII